MVLSFQPSNLFTPVSTLILLLWSTASTGSNGQNRWFFYNSKPSSYNLLESAEVALMTCQSNVPDLRQVKGWRRGLLETLLRLSCEWDVFREKGCKSKVFKSESDLQMESWVNFVSRCRNLFFQKLFKKNQALFLKSNLF
jgi:hypothetical protein